MILSREECRALSAYLHNVQWVLDDVPPSAAAIIARITAEANKPDVLPPGTMRGSDGVIRPDPRKDDVIRKGDVVWQSNNPGAKVADLFRRDAYITGVVKLVSQRRAYVEYPESDALPFGYAAWIDFKHLNKGLPPK